MNDMLLMGSPLLTNGNQCRLIDHTSPVSVDTGSHLDDAFGLCHARHIASCSATIPDGSILGRACNQVLLSGANGDEVHMYQMDKQRGEFGCAVPWCCWEQSCGPPRSGQFVATC